MRILWGSNLKAQSGYAGQARLFVPRIQRAGHHVAVFEMTGGNALPHEWNGVNVLPIAKDPLGNDILPAHVQHGDYHALITLVDAWGLRPDVMEKVNWFPIVPVDTQPAAPHVLNSLQAAKQVIAISRFGLERLKEKGIDALYLPHGIDPQVWHPLPNRAALRAEMGLNESTFFAAFVGVNDSNPSRKGIAELLMAWNIFVRQHPDSILYLHTSATGNMGQTGAHGGVDIPELIRVLGFDQQTVRLVDWYRYTTGIPPTELNMIANIADVLIIPSRGEGFCLPLLEFARAGCPMITTNFAAQRELCFSGWLLEGEPEWNWQSAFVLKPGITHIVERLIEARSHMNDTTLRETMVACAREYDIDHIFARYGLPVLETIAETVLERA